MTVFAEAKKNNVVIVVEPLANVYAYYNKVGNQKFIHINDTLSEHSMKYLIGHMLYFALHEKDEFRLLSKEFTESEKAATIFSLKLLKSKLSNTEMKQLFEKLKHFWGKDKIEPILAQLEHMLHSEIC